MPENNERDIKRAKYKTYCKIWNWAVFLTIVTYVISIASVIIIVAIGPGYQFDNAAGGHFKNAKNAATPELIISELQQYVQGLHDLGLTDDMYSGYFSWEKVPQNSMAFYYANVQSIINRTQNIIVWRDSTMQNNTLRDVYNDKVDNIHTLINDLPSKTWNAYMVNYYPVYYFMPLIFIVLTTSLAVIFFTTSAYIDFKYRW